MDSSISIDQIIEQLMKALNCSKHNVTHPTDWKVLKTEFLKNINSKTLQLFYKGAKTCEVSLDDNIIGFLPTNNIDDKGRFDHLPDLEIKVSLNNREEVYKAVIKAFDNCT